MTAEIKTYTLAPFEELRIEVDFSSSINVFVKSGFAECFGAELALNVSYLFSGRKFALYSWQGATIEVSGICVIAYVAGNTPMNTYLNTHSAIQNLRTDLKSPRVLILGQSDCGKTCLSKILLNYAVKMQQKPLFVDLDVSEGSISLAGTLTAATISAPIDPEEEFGFTPVTSNRAPICYYYGSEDCYENTTAYVALMKQLAQSCEKKNAVDVDSKIVSNIAQTAGFIINSPSQFSETTGLAILEQVITAFNVNVLLVIGHERLYTQLLNKFNSATQTTPIHVIKLEKSGGVVSRDLKFRKLTQSARIREYFYGTKTLDQRATISPYSNQVLFKDINVCRITVTSLAPSSALPLGTNQGIQEAKFIKVIPGDILLHSVLALSFVVANPGEVLTSDEESRVLLESMIKGFVYVSESDEETGMMTVLCPSPQLGVGLYLMLGGLKWVES